MTISQIALVLEASEAEVQVARKAAGVVGECNYDGSPNADQHFGSGDLNRIHAHVLLARGYDPLKISGCQASDPVTPRATSILGWLIGQGGELDEKAFEDRLARRHVDDRGTVGVSYACIGHNILFRRGFIESSRDGVIRVTPQGQAYFDSL